ncbi:MAG: hypothetical protein AABX70_01110 [Nanoarchaeota archaeon]
MMIPEFQKISLYAADRLFRKGVSSQAITEVPYPGHRVSHSNLFTTNVNDCCSLILVRLGGKPVSGLTHYDLLADNSKPPEIYTPEILKELDNLTGVQAALIGGDENHLLRLERALEGRVPIIGRHWDRFGEYDALGEELGSPKDIALDTEARNVIVRQWDDGYVLNF